MTSPTVPERPRRSHRAAIATVVCAVVLGAAGTAYVLTRSGPQHRGVAEPPAPAPLIATTAPPTVAVAAPRRPAPPHDYVPAAAPTSFTLTGHAFTIKAHVCSMPAVFPLDPPGEQHHTVCWVQKDFGVAPGSRSGTSYLLGHSWAEDPLEVLNKASEPATREILRVKPRTMSGVPVYPVNSLDGYRLVLRTRTGKLTYQVRDAYGVRKTQLGLVKQALNERIAKRIVLITCAELNGIDYEYNVVLDAYLVSSVRRSVT